MRNSIKKALSRVWNRLFDPWWDFYYTYGSRVPPLKNYLDGYSHLEDVDWDKIKKRWHKDYDPVCFPLPFHINCIGCMGCSSVKNPPLQPDMYKGPYKVGFSEHFIKQYEELCGKDAVFDLLWTFQKHNIKVETKGVNMLEETEEVVEHSDQGR